MALHVSTTRFKTAGRFIITGAAGVFVAAMTLFMLSGCNKNKSALGEGVLATVGGDAITVDDFKTAAKGKIPSDIAKKKGLLSELINNRLAFKKAHSEGFEMVDGIDSMLQNIYVERLPSLMINKVAEGVKVTDDELEMYRPTDTVAMMNVTMVIAKTAEGAETILAELKKGTSFDDVAKRHADLLQEAIKQDRQVSLNDELYPVGVRAALNKLKPGELSPAMKLDIGYGVFRLESRIEPDQQWAREKEALRDKLKKQAVDHAVDELIQKLIAQSKIEEMNTPDGPVAIVDGTTISVAEKMSTQKEAGPHAPHTSMNVETVRGALQKAVKGFLLAREARKAGLDKDPEVQRAVRLETDKVIANGYLDKLSEGFAATPAEIQDYYNKNKDKFGTARLVRVSRILVDNDGQAAAVLKALKSGMKFEAAAAQYSKDTESASKGGDVGFVDPTELKEPMGKAVEGLKAGEVSRPLKSDYGIEVLKVTEIRPATVQDISEVKETIAKRVALIKRADMVEALFIKLRKEYPVKVDEKLLMSVK